MDAKLQSRAGLSAGAVLALVLVIGAACALILAGPGQTITTKYVNDLFVFLDGAHRIDIGQVPNRDFHTALGPLTFYIPAVGYWLTGDWGAAMPLGMALLVLALAPVAAHIVSSRLRPVLALPIAAYLLVVLAMPLNPGENMRSLSFAMFYNRVGWAALGFLLVMYLRPHSTDGRPRVVDALCAGALTLLMLYTKASYGFVAVGFLVLVLLDRVQRGWALSALSIVAGLILGVEALWRGTLAHAADIVFAARVSGGLGTPDQIGDVVLRNLADYLVFAVIAGLALLHRRSIRDLLFFGFCAGAGFLLMGQNYQVIGMVILAPAAAVAAEQIARTRIGGRRAALGFGAPLALLALVAAPLIHGIGALGLHGALGFVRAGVPVPLERFANIRLVELWGGGEYPAFVKYFETLREGREDLAAIGPPSAPVLVLDFVNPFTAGLGLAAPRGDSAWYHWSRTLDDANHPDPAPLFRGVQVVMDPKWPIEAWTAGGMRGVYAAHLEEHYDLARESQNWRVYRRKPPQVTSAATAGAPAPEGAAGTR